MRCLPLVLSLALVLTPAAFAISETEMDDFEDGSTEGWGHGAGDTGLVVNVADGGPDGAGDNFLQVTSTGTTGPGSRLVVLNAAQWTGDYNAVGSEFTISMSLAAFPPPEESVDGISVDVRLGVEAQGLEEGLSTRYVSTTPFNVPIDGVWRTTSFTLSDAEMTQVEGTASLSEVLDAVEQMRILSASTTTWFGDAISAVLGVDDIQVVSVPVELMSFDVE